MTRRARNIDTRPNPPVENATASRPFSLARLALVLIVPIIAYASLRPFHGWRHTGNPPFGFLFTPPRLLAPFDVLLNIAGYVFLGLCLTLALFPRVRGARALAIGSFAPALFSLLVEAIQTYLPGRYPSLIDVGTNTLGATIGAALAVLCTPWLLDHRGGRRLRERWLVPGHGTELGVLVLLIWFATLFAQRTILFGTGDLRANFGATIELTLPPILYTVTEVFIIAANLVTVGLILRLVMAGGVARVRWFFALVAAAIVTRFVAQLTFWKLAAAFHWITPTALMGLTIGSAIAIIVLDMSQRAAAITGLALIAAAVIVVNAAPPDPDLWLQPNAPRERMLVGLVLVARYAAKGWPLAAMIYLVLALRQIRTGRLMQQGTAHSP